MLKDLSILKNLTEEDLKTLENNLKILKFRKRETIFLEGQTPDGLYILFKGKVKISKFASDGREIVLEIIDAPDFFGALAVLKNFPFPANAIAMENCDVGRIPAKVFLQVINKYPHLETQMLHHITVRLKSGIESLKNIALEEVSSRIAYQLLKLANKYGKNTTEGVLIDFRITKQQLAEMTGTTTETAIRVISKLKKLGYLSEINHKFLIKDIRAISALF
ncbi:MAG: Crp/Fnr family transcriptional regulator [Thermodesulfovibrio sp.]|nr:Crp/Fnr family transcriptional regulator [Thermodesulfovibrio sp.]MDW7999281.1 Crp/Fnr family transcriptional regulator [Thermodesulfovibrio sp.]